MEQVFESRVSKKGPIYYIVIPNALRPFAQVTHGRRVLVHVKVLEEGKA